MKKVLVAIDYNPVSEKVINEGYRLSKLLKAEICLMHVVTDIGFYQANYPAFIGYEGYSMAPDLNLVEEGRARAEDFLKAAAQHLDDSSVSTYLGEGRTAKTILAYAEEWKADLIVMGTHSHSALEKLLMGTVASTVLEKTNIPVYMVPVKERD